MIAFLVKQGAKVRVVEEGVKMFPRNTKEIITKKENLFFLEDVVFEPRKAKPGHQAYWARLGYTGFKRDGWILMARPGQITVG